MSYGQEQLWVHSQFANDVPIYNDPITMYRYGPMDRAALEKALTEIVRRHRVVGEPPLAGRTVHSCSLCSPRPRTSRFRMSI